MELHHHEEEYSLPFKQKAKPKLKVHLVYICSNIILILLFIYAVREVSLSGIDDFFDSIDYISSKYPSKANPLIGAWVSPVLLAYSTYLWIWTTKEYISVTEDCIAKKTRKGIKKAQWNEIQDVQLFERAKTLIHSELKEEKLGSSVGIILKEQYKKINPWEPKKNDVGEYYIAISEDHFDGIDIQKLYSTIKSQINKHCGESISTY